MRNQTLNIRNSFLSTILLSIIVLGCSDNKTDNKDQEPMKAKNDTVSSGAKTEEPAFLGSSGKYAVLKLSKNDLLTLFSGSGVKKLLIGFTDNNDAAAPVRTINAIAYGAKNNNETVGAPVFLFPENIANPKIWDTTGVQILGNDELSLKEVKKALGNVTTLDPTTAKDLYFYPIKNANNHIAYVVSKDLVQFVIKENNVMKTLSYPEDGGYANPSPPATPCTSCD